MPFGDKHNGRTLESLCKDVPLSPHFQHISRKGMTLVERELGEDRGMSGLFQLVLIGAAGIQEDVFFGYF